MSVGAGHDHRQEVTPSYHEPGFVEVVDVIVNDSVLCARFLNQAKQLVNHFLIFTSSPPASFLRE